MYSHNDEILEQLVDLHASGNRFRQPLLFTAKI
jgi:hypothetical protein